MSSYLGRHYLFLSSKICVYAVYQERTPRAKSRLRVYSSNVLQDLNCPLKAEAGQNWYQSKFSAAKHFSVGLILLQRRRSNAVTLQCRCIPKCQVKVPLCSLLRRSSDAVAVQRRCIPKCNVDSVSAPTLSGVKSSLFYA